MPYNKANIVPTPNLELPQWQLSDKPAMEDFNEAFRLIDAGVGELREEANEKIGAKVGKQIEEFDIVYNNGLTNANHRSFCTKTETGIVTVVFKCVASTPLASGVSHHITTVPQIFWPMASCVHTSCWQSTSNNLHMNGTACGCWIHSNGSIILGPSVSGGTHFAGYFVYQAAN